MYTKNATLVNAKLREEHSVRLTFSQMHNCINFVNSVNINILFGGGIWFGYEIISNQEINQRQSARLEICCYWELCGVNKMLHYCTGSCIFYPLGCIVNCCSTACGSYTYYRSAAALYVLSLPIPRVDPTCNLS